MMKRTVALFLALIMMFVLCGCGSSKELTQEEKEKIYEEVAKEKSTSAASQATETTGNQNSEETHFIPVSLDGINAPVVPEEIKLRPQNSNMSRGHHINVRIKNISDSVIDVAQVLVRALDENGDVIAEQEVSVMQLGAGKAGISGNYVLDCPYGSVYNLEVISYKLGDFKSNNTTSSWIVRKAAMYEEPIIFELKK